MNSNQRLFFSIFIIAITDSIHLAFGLNEPLYFTKSPISNEYFFTYDVRYDDANQHLVVVESFGEDVFVACPQNNDSNSLEIREKVPKKASFALYCKTSIKSHAYLAKPPVDFLPNDIGFLTKLPLVKVELAPAEDFFFENWKSASRHNVITAPMWSDFLPQWQALEIFIRKVTQIIDSVKVITGVHDTLTKHRFGHSAQKLYLHDDKHPIPKYFWKAIYFEIRFGYAQDYFHGIIFVMHNVDPSAKSSEQKICPNDDVSKTGWQFLENNEFKTLMYGCYYNEANLEFFQEKLYTIMAYDPFDLHDVPVRETNDEGKTIGVRRVNVIEEMQKLKQEKTDEFD